MAKSRLNVSGLKAHCFIRPLSPDIHEDPCRKQKPESPNDPVPGFIWSVHNREHSGEKIYLNPATPSQFQRATAEPRAARRQVPLLYCLTRVKSSSLGKMRMADHLDQLSSRKIWMSYLDGLEDLDPFLCTPAFPETSLQPGVGQREPRQLSTLQP